MNFEEYLNRISMDLIESHQGMLLWFRKDQDLRNYRPTDSGWTINEILEHITLTSHFLLIIIEKTAKKAIRKSTEVDLSAEVSKYHFDQSKMKAIGITKSFDWIRPEHMEPTGTKSEVETIRTAVHQLHRCLGYLNDLKNGEGILQNTTMTVNNLGKINVYEYLNFLSQHIFRHIQQMERVKKEYLNK